MANRTTKQQRDIKLAFAKALIISNPNLGKDAINKAVRKEYGTGLRRIDVAKLKDATLFGRPKRSTGIKSAEQLIKEQILVPSTETQRSFKIVTIGFDTGYHMMRSAGFLDFEIRNLFSAKGGALVFSSQPFRDMLKYRRQFVKSKLKKGWTKPEIIKNITQHYQVKDAVGKPLTNPFDFLREAYDYDGRKPAPHKAKVKDVINKTYAKDYEIAKQKKAAKKVAKLYGRR